MKPCLLCASNELTPVLDCGPQPICNRFLPDPAAAEFLHPLVMVQCSACGTLQLSEPVSAAELHPRVDWITYNEPEGHLDALTEILSGLPDLDSRSVIGGVSFKDDTTIARLNRKGFPQSWRLDPASDLGIETPGVGVETLQDRLTPERAAEVVRQRGLADLLIIRHIFEHAHRPAEFLGSLRTLVRPGGWLIFEVPDCSRALDGLDYTTLWEEHTLYFTPVTFRNALMRPGLDPVRFECYPYPFENSLVGIVRNDPVESAAGATESKVALERARGYRFGREFGARREAVHRQLTRFRRQQGPVAILGAGHLACAFVNLLGLQDVIDGVVDDNPHKQGLHLPGSRLPIWPSTALYERQVRLCLLSVNPEIEDRVAQKHQAFTAGGGIFASIFPASRYALRLDPAVAADDLSARFRRVNEEVLVATEPIVTLEPALLRWLKEQSRHNARRRIRICAHRNVDDRLHEMFIVHARATYVRPHKHLGKSESFHVIEGAVRVVLFDEDGAVSRVLDLGEPGSGRSFYYRLDEPVYHTLLIESEFLVFHETTGGPFRREETVFAPWAPDETKPDEVRRFAERLEAQIRARRGALP